MKTFAVLAALVLTSVPALAAPALIEKLTLPQEQALEIELARAIVKQTGYTQLREFRVDWKDAACLDVVTEMDPDVAMGACTVPFGAFQIAGHAVIVKTPRGYRAQILHADVE